MEEMELVYFGIISAVGTARSCFIDAIRLAKEGDFQAAEEMMTEGNQFFLQGHKEHSKLVQKEASGEKLELSLILVHAEDQMISAEGFKILAEEFIDVYKRIEEGK